jgi:hypothetical protein
MGHIPFSNIGVQLRRTLYHEPAVRMHHACFSRRGTLASAVTHDRAERHQICRRGVNSARWRRIPTRSV